MSRGRYQVVCLILATFCLIVVVMADRSGILGPTELDGVVHSQVKMPRTRTVVKVKHKRVVEPDPDTDGELADLEARVALLSAKIDEVEAEMLRQIPTQEESSA